MRTDFSVISSSVFFLKYWQTQRQTHKSNWKPHPASSYRRHEQLKGTFVMTYFGMARRVELVSGQQHTQDTQCYSQGDYSNAASGYH